MMIDDKWWKYTISSRTNEFLERVYLLWKTIQHEINIEAMLHVAHCNWIEYSYQIVESKNSGVKTFSRSVEATLYHCWTAQYCTVFESPSQPIGLESRNALRRRLTVLLILTMLLLLYAISILTLHNQNIDFANVKISNRCTYDLRRFCTFANTLLNLPTPFNIIRKYLNEHIPRKRLQASFCFNYTFK